MKEKKKIGKIIGIIFYTLVVVVVAYLGSFYIDKYKREKESVIIKVIFDDKESYKIENSLKLEKDKALLEWPYMFTISNEGGSKGLFQVSIKDLETNTIKRDKLSYVIICNDKEIKEGLLKDITDNILFEDSILGKSEKRYKLYIFSNSSDTKKEDIYEYKLEIKAIKDFGPGF